MTGRLLPPTRMRAGGSFASALASLGALLLAAPAHADAAAGADAPAQGPLQEIVVTAPLPGADLLLSEVPANVQRVTASQLDRGRSLNAADALGQLVASVNLNDTQANPFQPDVNFRGFTGSPILGTPQGVSVFVDGVRVNEAFGDAVNWALIPQAAISSLEVTPGSNPVFGLNTLGGAIIVTTKRGLEETGAGAQFEGGSFGRRSAGVDSGGHGGRWDYFVAGSAFDDDGWAEHNPSRVRQGFGKLGYRDGTHDVTLSLTYADSHLEGNQALPRSWLSRPLQAYTWPDTQRDTLAFIDLGGSRALGETWTLSGTLHWRKVDTDALNSNVNDDFDPDQPIGAGNEPAGNAIERIDQRRAGAALQLAGRGALAGHRSTFIAGAAYDRGTTHFRQYSQEAGDTRDTSSGAPRRLGTQLHAINRSSGVYVSETLGLGEHWVLNIAARYDDAAVTLQDRLGSALNGQHDFGRLNPAAGLTFNPSRTLTAYARYEEGTRTPTPVELTCADPEAPCSLPNAFAADPPLDAVVARTIEVGARGTSGTKFAYTAAVFRTNLGHDIQFISSGGGAASTGYFRNVGRTRRQGVELGLDARAGGLSLSAHYTYLDATFRSPLVLNSPNNSAATGISCADCTEIQVVAGNRLPGIPRHIVKLRTGYETARFSAGLTATAQSSQYARGDENNQDANGALPGYVLFNLDAHYELAARWSLHARIDNLLDRRYVTFATLGANVFTGPGQTFDPTGASWRAEQFRAVGVPRGAWFGVAYRVGAGRSSPGR